MLGDTCNVCNHPESQCTCSDTELPCLPADANGECDDWVSTGCVFWKGADIAGTPIKHNDRLSKILLYLFEQIRLLNAEVF